MRKNALRILLLVLALSIPVNSYAWVTVVPKDELYSERTDKKTAPKRNSFKDKGMPANIVDDPVSYAVPGRINIKLNGEYRYFYDEPKIVDGRVLLPFRELFEFFGMEVSWDQEKLSAKASSKDNEIIITVDDEKAYVNGKENILDVPAKIINNRTYVPVRFVGESLGYVVRWDSDEETVILSGGVK